MTRRRLRTGLLGLGRLGHIYARSLSSLIPATDLVAVCDTDADTLERVADEVQVARRYDDPRALVEDEDVEAVVIVSPTDTHRELLDLVAATGKPIFCEKPLSISLEETLAMKETVDRTGVFFQMGFQRRFDRGYAAAREKIEAGSVGSPVVFKSTSRDPYLPSLDYLKTSGGIFVDMGIHDFDLALWLFGEIERVTSVSPTPRSLLSAISTTPSCP